MTDAYTCPECSLRNINVDMAIVSGQFAEHCVCLDCNTEWLEIYKFSHCEDIDGNKLADTSSKEWI